MSSRHKRTFGFSLAELVLAMGIMTILVGGMASAVLVASHALPKADSLSQRTATAVEAAQTISRDLVLATSFQSTGSTLIEFVVPDRGHGASGAETIRYEWSGTPGDPLTLTYNGAAAVTVCDDVYDFSLEYVLSVQPLAKSPSVLLVVQNSSNPNAEDVAKQDVIESWGFAVQLLDDGSTQGAFDAAAAASDVMYVSCEASIDISPFIKDSPIGVVCEDGDVRVGIGIGKSSVWFGSSNINIVNNAHDITAPFSTGVLSIVNSNQDLMAVRQGLAGGATLLATDDFYGYDALVTVEAGGNLYNSGKAAARRVALPWGSDSNFDFQAVNADGLVLMRRAIVWAAAPIGISGVRITLQLGPDTTGRVETQAQLMNLPEAP